MKVSQIIAEAVVSAMIVVLVAGCTKPKEAAQATTTPSTSAVAPVSDPQAKQFLTTLAATPWQGRNALMKSNQSLVTKIMTGNDAAAKMQLKQLMGH